MSNEATVGDAALERLLSDQAAKRDARHMDDSYVATIDRGVRERDRVDNSPPMVYKSRPDGPVKTVQYMAMGATYNPSWGVQTMTGSHYCMHIPDGREPYGCELVAFHETHIPVVGGWRKSVDVTAYQVGEVGHVVETICNGEQEVAPTVVPVDFWVVKNPSGETYAISSDSFEAQYDMSSARPFDSR